MNTLNAGKTIDHSSKNRPSMTVSIPSYQHGKAYMLPEKKLPSSINYRRQQSVPLTVGGSQVRTDEVSNPVSVDNHTSNLNYAIRLMNEEKKVVH
jgi:hypothetical protein